MPFKMKRTTKLTKLRVAYSARIGLASNACRFVFNGSLLNDRHTPEFYGLKEHDCLDAILTEDKEPGVDTYNQSTSHIHQTPYTSFLRIPRQG